jgi:hypothetical protein
LQAQLNLSLTAAGVTTMSSLVLRTIALIFVLFRGLPEAGATPQLTDTISIQGKSFALLSEPLDAYLLTHALPKPSEGEVFESSANWRGYRAYWVIRKNRLYLTKIESENLDRRNLIREMFGQSSKVLAQWYSGTLVLSDGDKVVDIQADETTTDECYTLIEVDKGEVKLIKKLTLKEYLEWLKPKG